MRLPESVGVALRRRRYQLDMTQVDLAGLSATDRSFISDVETGKRNISLETFARLCTALKAEPWKILKEAGADAQET